jgi:hypothetical protein
MNPRGLIGATIVLALLGAGVWYSNREEAAKEGKPAADAPPKLVDVQITSLRELRLEHAGAPPVVLTRDANGIYAIAEPENAPVDLDVLLPLFTQAAAIPSDRLVEPAVSAWGDYGLAEPAFKVVLKTGDGKSRELLVGEATPTGADFFARLGGDQRLFTISQSVKDALDKTFAQVRDKHLLPFDRASLQRVELGPKLVFTKGAGGRWQVGSYRADESSVEQVLGQLDESKIDATVTAESKAEMEKAWATASALGLAKVTDKSGTKEMEVRRAKDAAYLKSSAAEGVHKAPMGLAEAMAKSADAYRTKDLFSFGFEDLSQIEVTDGEKKRTFVNAGSAKWTENGKPMDTVGIQSLIDKIRAWKASGFRSTGPKTSELTIAVTVGTTKAVERVLVGRDGTAWIAWHPGESEFYALEDKGVQEVKQTASDVREMQKNSQK